MNDDKITQAHGAGGDRMFALIREQIVSRFDEPLENGVGLSALDDGAALPISDTHTLIITTDSHVVTPRTFPGGDIGQLAVAGTVNDLAVMGAIEPLSLTCGLIIEEGFPKRELTRYLESMHETAVAAGCTVHTGDTKVMGAGEVDGLVVNTTGVGLVTREAVISDAGLQPDDVVIATGSVGNHGLAILAQREGIEFGTPLESDVRPVNDLAAIALETGSITAMTDPTRGGLAGALTEFAEKAEVGITLDEQAVPVADDVAAAGEMLGIDPFAVANEGVVVLGVKEADATAVLSALRDHPDGSDAAVIGRATDDHPGRVVVDTGFGRRYLTKPTSDPLPRIC